MGAQIRVYRQKIASTSSMKKIFKAMELIATSRITKARERVSASLPYANAITRAGVSSSCDVVAPVTTIDSPSAMMTNSWNRSAKCSVPTSHASGASRGRQGTQKVTSGAP